jgi:hypothetical protein
MKFNMKNSLAGGIGHKIEVQVIAEGGETISRVTTAHGGFDLANDDLTPPQVQFERIFTNVDGYTPGRTHTITVTAVNDRGIEQIASRTWTD